MKKILMTQLTWLLLLTHMVFGTTYGPELIKDAGNENGSLKYRSQHWHGHFNMLRAYKGDTYLLTGNARYAYIYQPFTTEVGKAYEVKATLIGADESRNQHFKGGSIIAIANATPRGYKSNEIAQSQAVTTGTPTEITFSFTATGSTSYVVLRGDTSWQYPNLLHVSVKKKEDTPPTQEDTTPPVITLKGQSTVTLKVGDTYTDAGASASDDVDGDVSANIVTVNPVDTTTAGTYIVTYNVSDAKANKATQVSRTVVVKKAGTTTPPPSNTQKQFVFGVNIKGDSVTIEGNQWLSEAEASLILSDGTHSTTTNVTPNPQVDNDTSKMLNSVRWKSGEWSMGKSIENGDYTVELWVMENYRSHTRSMAIRVEDKSQNNIGDLAKGAWKKYTYDVHVTDAKLDIVLNNKGDAHIMGFAVFKKTTTPPPTQEDTTPPVITLKGQSTVTLKVGDTYTDAGATAIDNVDGDVTAHIRTTESVDTSKAGTYIVSYDVNDTAGNLALPVKRTVVVSAVVVPDTTPPVISLLGDANITLNVDDVFSDLGATATDDKDTNVSVEVNGTVDTSKAGTYTIVYTAKDKAGNLSLPVQRTVVVSAVLVPDTTPPVITLNGDANITLEQNENYTELGARAVDAVDGNLTVSISGAVDTSTVGHYTLTYTATDSAGNEANVTRSVEVVNTTPTLTSITLESNATTVNVGDTVQLTVTGTYSDGSSATVDENITYTIHPTENAEVNGSMFRAKKDGNVTVQATVDGVNSNTIALNITWIVNGHVLPPEPDPVLNNATLLGIDVNNNGVRDDVERWIYTKYKDKHPIHIDIAMQAARGYKLVLETPEKAKEIRLKVDAALFCNWYYWKDAKEFNDPLLVDEKIDTPVSSKYFNTKERKDIYLQYDKLLSGGVYDSPWADEMKAFCDFNTSKYGE